MPCVLKPCPLPVLFPGCSKAAQQRRCMRSCSLLLPWFLGCCPGAERCWRHPQSVLCLPDLLRGAGWTWCGQTGILLAKNILQHQLQVSSHKIPQNKGDQADIPRDEHRRNAEMRSSTGGLKVGTSAEREMLLVYCVPVACWQKQLWPLRSNGIGTPSHYNSAVYSWYSWVSTQPAGSW